MKESKWVQFKHAIKNPRADRLAKIEYQSHFLQMLGVTFVSAMLIYRGFWYIIFAFIFMLGINYSQGMNAYRKYHNIKDMMPKEEPKDYQKDISPSRRRGKIINYVFGSKSKWVSILLSVLAVYAVEILTNFVWWQRSLLYPLLIAVVFGFLYFGLFFKLANHYYKKEFNK